MLVAVSNSYELRSQRCDPANCQLLIANCFDIPLALAGPAVDFQLPNYQITQLRNSQLGNPAWITTRTEFITV
jgi:hypothetical protein